MEIVSPSGELILALDSSDLRVVAAAWGPTVGGLKHYLAQKLQKTRFQLQLFTVDSELAENDSLTEHSKLKLLVVELAKEPVEGFFDACSRGNWRKLEDLLQQQDPNGRDERHRLGLHIVVKLGDLRCTSLLLEALADVNLTSDAGETAMHMAARRGHVEILRLLVEGGASTEPESGRRPIHLAAQGGHAVAVELLLDRGASRDLVSRDGYAALHLAAENGHLDVVVMLISQGDDVNRATNEGWSSLHLASRRGHSTVVRVLLAARAQVDKTATDGEWTALHSSVEADQAKVATLLLSYRANVDQASRDGYAPVHLAASHGCLQVLPCLLAMKANTSLTVAGWGALHLAAQTRQVQAAKFLVEARAMDFGAVDGRTALHLAAEDGDVNMASCLLQSLTAASSLGFTPLHVAAQRGHVAIVRLLLEGLAPVDQEANGWTALHLAAQDGHRQVARLLIAYHADVAKTNSQGARPFEVAEENGYSELAGILQRSHECPLM